MCLYVKRLESTYYFENSDCDKNSAKFWKVIQISQRHYFIHLSSTDYTEHPRITTDRKQMHDAFNDEFT